MLAKPRGEKIHFSIVTPTGERKEVEAICGGSAEVRVKGADGQEAVLVPERNSSGQVDMVNVEPMFHTVPGPYSSVQHEDLGNGIQYVRIDSFMDPRVGDVFDALVPALAKAKGLIIDMRFNPGGNDDVGIRIAQNFTRGNFRGFASRSRKVIAAYKAWGKSIDPKAPMPSEWDKEVYDHYRGNAWEIFKPQIFHGSSKARLLMPKVVLIGGATASAAEDSLIYYEDIPSITTVGTDTFGGTGQPLSFDLPGGGRARVCTQRCTFPDGREFMGEGIAPKVRAEQTGDDFLAGRDAAFEKGMEVL